MRGTWHARLAVKSMRFARYGTWKPGRDARVKRQQWDWWMPALLGLVTVGGFVVVGSLSLRRVRPFIADAPKVAPAVALAGGIVLYSGSLILLGLRRRRRDVIAARLRAGLCPRCGYDLRVNDGRCPECGAPVPARPGSKVP